MLNFGIWELVLLLCIADSSWFCLSGCVWNQWYKFLLSKFYRAFVNWLETVIVVKYVISSYPF